LLHRTLFCALALPLFLLAADASKPSAPVSGVLVDDATASIRPLVGNTGSAHTGDASVSDVQFALAAPDGRTALVVRDDRISIIRRVQTQLPVWRNLTEERVSVDRAVWSQDSNALAIYDEAQAKIFFWKNAQSDPAPAGQFDMSQFPNAPASLALDPEARFVFATFLEKKGRERDGASLVVIPVGGVAQTLLTLSRPGAMFLSGGTLYIADRGRAEVYALSNWITGLTLRTVVAAGNGITDPAGIALSPDGKQLYVADAGSRQVLAFELGSSEQKAAVQLDFPPTRMDLIAMGSLYLLDKGTSGESPAQVLQAPDFQVVHVPVGAGAMPSMQEPQ
jgi:DNA-binding beta-propeller fold protein YncE